MKNNIVLTGGHAATAALATINSLGKSGLNWRISWIGSRYSIPGKNTVSLEFKAFPELGVRCYNIITGKLQRRWTGFSLVSLVKIPVGFLHAFLLLLYLRPKVVISFGGFAAFPVVVAAWVMGKPVIVHEQTSAVGLANKMSIPFAQKIAIARDGSRKYFPIEKTILTGNPVGEKFFEIKPKNKIGTPPVIFVTGGSRGSQIFNQTLFDALTELVKDYVVIHQCGELDLPKAQKVRNSLPLAVRKKYQVYGSIPPNKMPEYFEEADIILGRAGANTVAEVIAARRPAVFVPIPWAQNDEQTKNATIAVNAGMAKVIKQDELNAKLLLETIARVRAGWNKMASRNSEIRKLDEKGGAALATLAADFVK